jgi:hypothetical protein
MDGTGHHYFLLMIQIKCIDYLKATWLLLAKQCENFSGCVITHVVDDKEKIKQEPVSPNKDLDNVTLVFDNRYASEPHAKC